MKNKNEKILHNSFHTSMSGTPGTTLTDASHDSKISTVDTHTLTEKKKETSLTCTLQAIGYYRFLIDLAHEKPRPAPLFGHYTATLTVMRHLQSGNDFSSVISIPLTGGISRRKKFSLDMKAKHKTIVWWVEGIPDTLSSVMCTAVISGLTKDAVSQVIVALNDLVHVA